MPYNNSKYNMQMKKFMMTMIATMMIVAATAQQVQTNIKVNGFESKAKIEAAAKATPGVKQATYNEKTKTLNVVYDKKQTTPVKVRSAVLKVDKKNSKQIKNTAKKAIKKTTKKATVNQKVGQKKVAVKK